MSRLYQFNLSKIVWLLRTYEATVQHYLLAFSLIGTLVFDLSGGVAGSHSAEGSSVCCCSGMVNRELKETRSCCHDSETTPTCVCGCSAPQKPQSPSSRQTAETRSEYQRTLTLKIELLTEEGNLQFKCIEDPLFGSLLCSARRRAILCCWIT